MAYKSQTILDVWRGERRTPYVIAEVGMAHDGSLGMAHAFIDAIAGTGAAGVKFQTHCADAESTPAEPFRVRPRWHQDKRRFDYWSRTAFTPEQWAGLAKHCTEKGLDFLSTPFSLEAVDLLESVAPPPAWKIASGEVTNIPLLERAAKTGRPIILSSGMSPWADIDAGVAAVKRFGVPLAVLQCTTAYPCPPEKIGLNVIGELRNRYESPVGLSDHSGTIFPGLAAAMLDAQFLEVHVTLSRHAYGPDVPASLTVPELQQLIQGHQFLATMKANPVDKDIMATQMGELRGIFQKSIVSARELPKGHVLQESDFAFKKPGTGIPAAEWPNLVGRRLRRPVEGNTLLTLDDLE